MLLGARIGKAGEDGIGHVRRHHDWQGRLRNGNTGSGMSRAGTVLKGRRG